MVATDVLVIGSGAAGLAAAREAAERGARVMLVTGGALLSGSSPRAQGGLAAAVGADDDVRLHDEDTLKVGAGLNDREAVSILVREGADVARRLLSEGAPFEAGEDGPELGLEAGHSRRRILHAGGGASGWWLTRFLAKQVVQTPGVAIREHLPLLHFKTQDERVVGACFGQPGGPRQEVDAEAVILATGGAGALWGRTTNAPETRGVGIGLAWLAGATLADLEMVQFHPTALLLPGQPAFLLSEALRGEGAQLVDADEHPFVDPLLPRDVVARAVARQIDQHGAAYLSLRHLDAARVHQAFPALAKQVAERGLDLARDLLPVGPAAHYLMGGVRTDADGRTDVPGLFVAGEAACTGAQGANRLASNSLLECLVFGRRAARAATSLPLPLGEGWGEGFRSCHPEAAAEGSAGERDVEEEYQGSGLVSSPRSFASLRMTKAMPSPVVAAPRGLSQGEREGVGFQRSPLWSNGVREGTFLSDEREPLTDLVEVGALLDCFVGVTREASGLLQAICALPDPNSDETPPDLRVAGFAARAAFLRRESRGAHYRSDYRETDPRWRGRICWRRGELPTFEEV
jgi:L-aspartate oxidase